MILWIFWIVVGLLAVLVISNAIYAFRNFMTKRDKLWLITYIALLGLLVFFIFKLTVSAMGFVESAKETVSSADIYP